MAANACLLFEGPESFLFLLQEVHSLAKQSRPAHLLDGERIINI